MKTLVQAQLAFIAQVNSCHTRARTNRVKRSAWLKLYDYWLATGASREAAVLVCRDAWDMAELERNSED